MNAGSWISVKDKLPERLQEVLVWTEEPTTMGEGKHVTQWHPGYFVMEYDPKASKWYDWQRDEYFFGVTHWQPLPQPPAP